MTSGMERTQEKVMTQSSLEFNSHRARFTVPVNLSELRRLVSPYISHNALVDMLIHFKVRVREEHGFVYVFLRDIPLKLLRNCAVLKRYYKAKFNSIYEIAMDITMDGEDVYEWVVKNNV